MKDKIQYELSVFNGILFVLLLVGCVYQVIDITRLFIGYKTTINVKLEKESVVELPALTLCSNVTQTIDRDYLKSIFPEEVDDNTPKWKLQEYLLRLSVREQMHFATVGPNDIFDSCYVLKTRAFEANITKDWVQCSEVTPIRQYQNINTKCFTILSQLEGEDSDRYRIDHDISVSDNAFILIEIFLNKTYLDALYVFIHSRQIPFMGSFGVQSSDLQIYPVRYQGYSLTYSKTTTELLPSPYETKCFNYSLINYKSQSDCIVKCKSDYFQKYHKLLHPFIHRSEDTESGLFFTNSSLAQNKSLDQEMSKYCAKNCGKNDNCFDEFFDIRIVEKWNNSEFASVGDNLFDLKLYLPTGMTVKYSHSPRLQFIEYVCYLASIVNLWFGISILTCSKVILAIYYIIFNTSVNKRGKTPSYYCFL